MKRKGVVKKVDKKLTAMKSNAQGHLFEDLIKMACGYYREKGKAVIEKMPEPFRVLKKDRNRGTALVQFTSHAQPDFIGTLKNGKTIIFEAKCTLTDRLKQEVITETQWKALEQHFKIGAFVGVCAGIKDSYYFIPWSVWRDMKNLYGHKYMTATEAEKYKVRFTGSGVMFLDLIERGAKYDKD